MDPIRPSDTFLQVYPPVDRARIDPLIQHLNERLQSGQYTFSYRVLKSWFPGLTDYLIAYTIQLFREHFWEVDESPQHDYYGDDITIVFTLPKQHAA